MLYNSFRVRNYTHIYEVLFKQRIKKSKKKREEESKDGFKKSFTFNFTTNAFLLFFPLTADNFVSFLSVSQSETRLVKLKPMSF